MKQLIFLLLITTALIFGCDSNQKKGQSQNISKEKTHHNDSVAQKEISETNPVQEDEMEEKLTESQSQGINKLISLFKKKDINAISQLIHFPLKREYPIPPIRNVEEMKRRFDEVFDQDLCDRIANSKLDDWSEIGWRGVQFNNGELWLWEAEESTISAVNYQSDLERKQWNYLVNLDKSTVHASINQYIKPVYKIKTVHYLIRIDEMENDTYRYASWKIENDDNTLPELILSNGKLEFEGSGGNHVITFKQGKYTYKIYRNIIGENGIRDFSLVVIKNNEEILTEDGDLVY